jgi:hypothetical protein
MAPMERELTVREKRHDHGHNRHKQLRRDRLQPENFDAEGQGNCIDPKVCQVDDLKPAQIKEHVTRDTEHEPAIEHEGTEHRRNVRENQGRHVPEPLTDEELEQRVLLACRAA